MLFYVLFVCKCVLPPGDNPIAVNKYKYIMSVRPSIRMEQFGPYWADFREILYLIIFRKSVEKIKFSWKLDKKRLLYMNTNIHSLSSLSLSLNYTSNETSFRQCCGENQTIYYIFFFRKSFRLWDTVEKYCRKTYENMAHAHCMLYNWGYKHTLKICNTYCLSTTTMVAWERLNVRLYVHCLSCLTSEGSGFNP